MSLKNNDANSFKFQWNITEDDGYVDQGEIVLDNLDKGTMLALIAGSAMLSGKDPSSVIATDRRDGEYRVRELNALI